MRRQWLIWCVTVTTLGMAARDGLAQPPPAAAVAAPPAPNEPEAIPVPPATVPPPRVRAALGVQLVSAENVAAEGTHVMREGARIAAIVPGSPADRVGLPLGGVIVAIDGRKVRSPADAAGILHTLPPDAKIELKYYDGQRLYRKTVQLAPVAEGFAEPTAVAPETPAAPRPWQSPGDRRRLWDGIGRIVDEFAPPGAIPPGVPFGPPAAADRLAELQAQIDALRKQCQELQRKVEELEKRLPATPSP